MLTLQALRHPHVVQFLGACMRPAEPLCLVTELLPHSLHDVLHAMPGVALDAKRCAQALAFVASACAHTLLHELNSLRIQTQGAGDGG